MERRLGTERAGDTDKGHRSRPMAVRTEKSIVGSIGAWRDSCWMWVPGLGTEGDAP